MGRYGLWSVEMCGVGVGMGVGRSRCSIMCSVLCYMLAFCTFAWHVA
jgi:hypothetical protein